MNLSEKTLEIALSQEGVSEKPKGSNSGPEVSGYLKSVGLIGAYPWCMSFVYWCVQQAADDLGIKNPLVRTGGVMRQWNETTCRKIPIQSSAIKPGDIFIMRFPGGLGHTGFIVEVKGSLVKTIEGNTNDDGSREGYEVAIRERSITQFIGLIQLA